MNGYGGTIGTSEQTEIVENYPMRNFDDKLKVPYIERFNGNISVKNNNLEEAIKHYNKALMGMKFIFESDKEKFMNPSSREDAIKYIREIEIPCSLNLSHCYNKIGDYHLAIKYAS